MLQDVCLVPLTTMIISPLIIRRQLWLTGVLLVLTTILIAGRNGLAHSLMVCSRPFFAFCRHNQTHTLHCSHTIVSPTSQDISKRDSDCMVVGPLEWMGNGLSMLSWYSGQQSTSTLEHTAAPLLWLIHVIMAQCVPMVRACCNVFAMCAKPRVHVSRFFIYPPGGPFHDGTQRALQVFAFCGYAP